jgi:hypothetical protein
VYSFRCTVKLRLSVCKVGEMSQTVIRASIFLTPLIDSVTANLFTIETDLSTHVVVVFNEIENSEI